MNSLSHTQTLPALQLESTDGAIDLRTYQGKQNLVIYLMREFSCAICQGHVRRLKAIYPELQAANTTVLIVGGGNLEQAQQLKRQLQLPFPVLADTVRKSYAQFGLDRILGLWQKSGTVVTDSNGIIKLIHATGNPAAGLFEPALRAAIQS